MIYETLLTILFFVSLIYFGHTLGIQRHIDLGPRSAFNAVVNPVGAICSTAKVAGLLAADLAATTGIYLLATKIGLMASHAYSNWRFLYG